MSAYVSSSFYDEEGFYTLVPKKRKNTVQCGGIGEESPLFMVMNRRFTADDLTKDEGRICPAEDAEITMERLRSENLRKDQEIARLRAENTALKKQVDLLMKENQRLSSGGGGGENRMPSIDDAITGCGNEFSHGIGVHLEKGREPKIYRISDYNRDPSQRHRNGLDFQVQPGRGFKISVRHRHPIAV